MEKKHAQETKQNGFLEVPKEPPKKKSTSVFNFQDKFKFLNKKGHKEEPSKRRTAEMEEHFEAYSESNPNQKIEIRITSENGRKRTNTISAPAREKKNHQVNTDNVFANEEENHEKKEKSFRTLRRVMTVSRLGFRKHSVTDIEYVFPQDFEETSVPRIPTSKSFPNLPPPLPPPFQEKPSFNLKITPKIIRAVSIIQRQYRFWSAKKELEKRKRYQTRRSHIVKEIISTEKVYVYTLRLTVEKFLIPLRQNKLISTEDINLLFSNIEVILNINLQLLNDLEVALNNWSPHQKIGNIFLKMSHLFRMYTTYVKNYNVSIAKLNELAKYNQEFNKFLKDTISTFTGEFKLCELTDCLICPIQRIPRYKLLLNDLLKMTWTDHIDYNDIKDGLSNIEKVAHELNEYKKRAENIQKLLEMKQKLSKLDFNIVDSSRIFIKQGELVQIVKEKRRERLCVLFNDFLLITKNDKSVFSHTLKWAIKYKIALKEAIITDLKASVAPNSFMIQMENKTSIWLDCSDDIVKSQWMKDITNAIKSERENRPYVEESEQEQEFPLELSWEIWKFQVDGYSTKYFEMKKKHLFKRKVPVSELLQYSTKPLTKSLLKLNHQCSKEAINTFKLISEYMESTNETNFITAQKLLAIAFMKPEMRDEIYCQICKQTNANPNLTSCLKGWELIIFCFESFPPSRDFEEFLKHYFIKTVKNDEKEPSICICAAYCLNRFNQIGSKKPKVLSNNELNQILENLKGHIKAKTKFDFDQTFHQS